MGNTRARLRNMLRGVISCRGFRIPCLYGAVEQDQMKLKLLMGKEDEKTPSPIFFLLYLLSQIRSMKLSLIIPLAHSHILNPVSSTPKKPLDPIHLFPLLLGRWPLSSVPSPMYSSLCFKSYLPPQSNLYTTVQMALLKLKI